MPTLARACDGHDQIKTVAQIRLVQRSGKVSVSSPFLLEPIRFCRRCLNSSGALKGDASLK